MLTKNVLELVAPFSYQASIRGYSAQGVANSPLDQTTRLSALSLIGEQAVRAANTADQPQYVVELAGRLAEDTGPRMGLGGLEPSMHTVKMDHVIEHISEKMRRIAFFIPSVVLPFTRDVVTEVQNRLQNFNVANDLLKDIVVLDYPEFVFSQSFVSSLAQYGEREYNYQTAPGVGVPSLPDEDLLAGLKVAAGPYFGALEAWINRVGISQVRDVFERLFVARNGVEDRTTVPLYLRGSEDSFFNSVITYYLASYLNTNIPEGTRTGPGAYREQCLMLRALAGNSILAQIKLILGKLQYGTVVHRYLDNQIFVFKNAYEEFINEGGSNEMLLGAYSASQRPYTKRDLMERAQEFESNWNRMLASANLNEATLKRQYTEQAADAAFRLVLAQSLTDTERAQIDMASLANRFTREYRKLHPKERDNLEEGIALAVARSRFEGTAASAILELRFEVLAANPMMDDADATSLALVNFIGDWVADTIEFKHVVN